MSHFMPPIAPVRNEEGRIVTPATLLPFCEISVEQVFQMITCNENLRLLTEQVRNAPDMRTAKATLLPLRDSLRHLHPPQQQMLPILLTADSDRRRPPRLQRRSRRNAPYPVRRSFPPSRTYVYQPQRSGRESISSRPARHFRQTRYRMSRKASTEPCNMSKWSTPPTTDIAARTTAKGVDGSGKDLVRACFLSHDPEALFRNI